MTTHDRTLEGYHDKVGEKPAREEVAERIQHELSESQGFARFKHRVMKATTPDWTVWMLMSGDKRVFIKEFKTGEAIRSHIYSRDAAERAFRTNRIRGWQDL